MLCLEVAEHPLPETAPTLVAFARSMEPVVLFSVTIPEQGRLEHLNEQRPDYWAALFENEGFVPVDCMRRRVWTNEKVLWWYRQNMILFVQKDYLDKNARLRAERETSQGSPLAVVHPMAFLHYRRLVKPSPAAEISFRNNDVASFEELVPLKLELARRSSMGGCNFAVGRARCGGLLHMRTSTQSFVSQSNKLQ